MPLSSADAKIFKKNKLFLGHKKLKKPPSKILKYFWFQNGSTEEFMFQNVAYRPTVYKTGQCHYR